MQNNQLDLPLPESLGTLTSLAVLDVSENRIPDRIPYSLGDMSALRQLKLGRNRLYAEFPDSLSLLHSLEVLDLRENAITGPLPDSIGSLRKLRHLSLQANSLEGTLPGGALHGLSSLETLELQENLLYGAMPSQVGELGSLRLLNLSNQRGTVRFSGAIPDDITLLNGLTDLHLQRNQFSAALPPQIWRMQSLETLFAQGNQLVGPMPHGIGYLRNLRELLLDDNLIDGTLPDTLDGMLYLRSLDLRENSLSGTIPPALGRMPRLKTLTAQQNRLSGSLPSTVGLLQALHTMELQQNALQGPLPTSLGLLNALSLLNMSHNNLSHAMPTQMGQLGTLEHLILNDNTPGLGALVPSTSGTIPNTLGGLSSVTSLALENNALTGQLPSFLQGDFVASRQVQLTGNPFFCPLPSWAIQNLSGVTCLHCPGEPTDDLTLTCSGHGICKDGTECLCEAAWNGFSANCSQLACPSTVVPGSEPPVTQYCNGVGTCYNTINSSVSCPASAADTVGIDFVASYLDCDAGSITIARCSCPPGTIPPSCNVFTATEAGNELVTSAAAGAAAPSLLMSICLAFVASASLVRR